MTESRLEKQLDIRHLVKVNLDLKILTSLLLSPTQRRLIKYQRARFIQDGISGSESSDLDECGPAAYKPERIEALLTELETMQITNETERKLVMGLIDRYHDPLHRAKVAHR